MRQRFELQLQASPHAAHGLGLAALEAHHAALGSMVGVSPPKRPQSVWDLPPPRGVTHQLAKFPSHCVI